MENYIVKVDIYMAFCMAKNSCKTGYFHLNKIIPKYLVFHTDFPIAKLK